MKADNPGTKEINYKNKKIKLKVRKLKQQSSRNKFLGTHSITQNTVCFDRKIDDNSSFRLLGFILYKSHQEHLQDSIIFFQVNLDQNTYNIE